MVSVHKGIAIYKTKASPYWFARVRDPKEQKYVVRSTKEKAQISARRRAEELAAEILGGHKPTPREFSLKYYATRFVQKGYRLVESGVSRISACGTKFEIEEWRFSGSS